MKGKEQFYVVKEKAVPEVLLKVVEAKKTAGDRKSSDRAGSSGSDWY